MADRTAIPRRIRRHRGCGAREQISRGGKRKRRGGGAAQKFATRRHGKLPEVSCRAEDAWYPVSHSYASHAQGQYWRSHIEAVKQVSHLLWVRSALFRDLRGESGLPPTPDILRLRANRRSGPEADQCIAQDESLFDHLVGTDKKCRWYFEAQLLRGPEIEDSFVSSWSLDRKVHGLVAAQNAVDIPRRLAVMIEKVCLVGHQTTGDHKKPERIDGRQTMARRKVDDQVPVNDAPGVRQHNEACVWFARQRIDRTFDLGSIRNRTWLHFDGKRRRCGRCRSEEIVERHRRRVAHQGRIREPRRNLLEQRQPLARDPLLVQKVPCD